MRSSWLWRKKSVAPNNKNIFTVIKMRKQKKMVLTAKKIIKFAFRISVVYLPMRIRRRYR